MSFSESLRKTRSKIRFPQEICDKESKGKEDAAAEDEDAEEETAVKNDVTLSAKAVGSVAARAQAWEK